MDWIGVPLGRSGRAGSGCLLVCIIPGPDEEIRPSGNHGDNYCDADPKSFRLFLFYLFGRLKHKFLRFAEPATLLQEIPDCIP